MIRRLLIVLVALLALPASARTFRDCARCAPLAVIPAGRFVMGFDGGEAGRPEGPAHDVAIPRPFALAVTETTNRAFARFVRATDYPTTPGCELWPKGDPAEKTATWRDPGYGRPPRPDEPVVCVSWNDAQAYAAWLAKTTGKPYRLPSEAEWEYAARAGGPGGFGWGDDAEQGCTRANLYDADAAGRFPWAAVRCRDGHAGVAPVGRYPANGFGLRDMIGNVWEWTQDCYVAPYPPGHGAAALEAGPCEKRTVRGGSWITRPDRNRLAFRGRDPADARYFMFGFRVARDLTPREAGAHR